MTRVVLPAKDEVLPDDEYLTVDADEFLVIGSDYPLVISEY